MDSGRFNSPADIKIKYPSASLLANDRIVFNIKGNNYRLIIKNFIQTSDALDKIYWHTQLMIKLMQQKFN